MFVVLSPSTKLTASTKLDLPANWQKAIQNKKPEK